MNRAVDKENPNPTFCEIGTSKAWLRSCWQLGLMPRGGYQSSIVAQYRRLPHESESKKELYDSTWRFLQIGIDYYKMIYRMIFGIPMTWETTTVSLYMSICCKRPRLNSSHYKPEEKNTCHDCHAFRQRTLFRHRFVCYGSHACCSQELMQSFDAFRNAWEDAMATLGSIDPVHQVNHWDCWVYWTSAKGTRSKSMIHIYSPLTSLNEPLFSTLLVIIPHSLVG